ncbi:16S rRNA (cytidine1402-2'-O)-methyltransferase [Alteromonadaceae bacterium Bs31]|nr:16S rRNA (cytidine1402-2'-O)-methyltransferase [Alteromonadaceae bacterium Bs31]
MQSSNALYIVATPIGNLEDITFRAVKVLQKADIIAAEDTRHSAKLLQHFGIETRLMAYHDHSNEQQTQQLLQRLGKGENIALISDAGTPLISDPGYRLVKAAREQGYSVVPIPGCSALVAALSAAGLPSDRFSFEGFLPAKSVARMNRLEALQKDPRTLIFYESPHRIRESVEAMTQVFGEARNVVLAREITKTYETFITTSFANLLEAFDSDQNQLRGEMVILVQGFDEPKGNDESLDCDTEKMMKLLMEELPLKKAAAIAAKMSGVAKNRLYQWGLEAK